MGIGYTEGSGVALATREVSEEHYQELLVAVGASASVAASPWCLVPFPRSPG